MVFISAVTQHYYLCVTQCMMSVILTFNCVLMVGYAGNLDHHTFVSVVKIILDYNVKQVCCSAYIIIKYFHVLYTVRTYVCFT